MALAASSDLESGSNSNWNDYNYLAEGKILEAMAAQGLESWKSMSTSKSQEATPESAEALATSITAQLTSMEPDPESLHHIELLSDEALEAFSLEALLLKLENATLEELPELLRLYQEQCLALKKNLALLHQKKLEKDWLEISSALQMLGKQLQQAQHDMLKLLKNGESLHSLHQLGKQIASQLRQQMTPEHLANIAKNAATLQQHLAQAVKQAASAMKMLPNQLLQQVANRISMMANQAATALTANSHQMPAANRSAHLSLTASKQPLPTNALTANLAAEAARLRASQQQQALTARLSTSQQLISPQEAQKNSMNNAMLASQQQHSMQAGQVATQQHIQQAAQQHNMLQPPLTHIAQQQVQQQTTQMQMQANPLQSQQHSTPPPELQVQQRLQQQQETTQNNASYHSIAVAAKENQQPRGCAGKCNGCGGCGSQSKRLEPHIQRPLSPADTREIAAATAKAEKSLATQSEKMARAHKEAGLPAPSAEHLTNSLINRLEAGNMAAI